MDLGTVSSYLQIGEVAGAHNSTHRQLALCGGQIRKARGNSFFLFIYLNPNFHWHWEIDV